MNICRSICQPITTSICMLREGGSVLQKLLSLPPADATGKIIVGGWEDVAEDDINTPGEDGLIVPVPGTLNALVPSGGLSYQHHRAVQNLLSYSEDFSNAVWEKDGTATVTGTNVINTPADGDGVRQTYNFDSTIGSVAVARVELSGSGTITLRLKRSSGGTYEATSASITLTSVPTCYSVSHTIANTGQEGFTLRVLRLAGNTATQVTANKVQLELVTGQANQNPGEYQKTDASAGFYGYATYNTTNGNTVAANVLTKAVGSPLSPAPVIIHHDASVNLFTKTRDLAGFTLRGGGESVTADSVSGSPAARIGGAILADKVNNLGAESVADIWYFQTGYPNDAPLATSFYLKDVGAGGVLVVQNPVDAALGKWEVDLSAVTGFDLITRYHPAVTGINEFTAASGGGAGFHFYAKTGTVDVAIDGMHQEAIATRISTPVIYAAGAATDRDARRLRHPISGFFNQDAGTLHVKMKPKFHDSMLSATPEGIVSTQDSATSLLYVDGSGFHATDGTNTATQYAPLVSGVEIQIFVSWSVLLNWLSIDIYWRFDGSYTWSFSDGVAYDGGFTAGDYLNVFYGLNTGSCEISKLDIYSCIKSLEELEAMV